jgi:hypothetical protein
MGIALLAGSWLLGLNYFAPASPWAWLVAVAAGTALFCRGIGSSPEFPSLPLLPSTPWRSSSEAVNTVDKRRWILPIVTLIFLLPAVMFFPWPYRVGPTLLIVGFVLHLTANPRPWVQRIAQGFTAAGLVLLSQGLAMEVYTSLTAQSHELPWPLPHLLAGVAQLLGIDAVADGHDIVIYSMRQVHRLGATRELWCDPATFAFSAGGITFLSIACWVNLSYRQCCAIWWRSALAFALTILVWHPIRAGLLMAVYLHRVLGSDSSQPLHAMNHFFSPWASIGLLIIPTLMVWRFVRWPTQKTAQKLDETAELSSKSQATPTNDWSNRKLWCAVGLLALASALFTAAVAWDPIGGRKEGRVMVVERHSTWEPTTRPYDTTWYGELASYNYAAMYDYLNQYFQMSRLLESDKIDDATLQKCDVLMIKTPTARYSPDEVRAVQRFVERGGGLLLIGDHTNLDRSSTTMNDLIRPMGFAFRNDLLFSFEDSPYDELYVRPMLPHPAAQHVPWFDFAVSCSIDPGHGVCRPVITGTRLWSMGPDYTHFENFHPIPQHCPEMRYGAFIQALAARYGQGRAIAFGDSTIFSSFCVFQPGKAELMLNMLEWLNHANPPFNPRPWLIVLGLLLLGGGIWLVEDFGRFWLTFLSAGVFGWAVAAVIIATAAVRAMPLPECQRPQTEVVIDRTTSAVPLSKGAYISGQGEGYGLFEQWISRLQCHTVRKEGDDAFSGDVLVAICPSQPVDASYRHRLIQYVENGGKLIVLDSPENKDSTANSLLWPFGLSIHHDAAWQGVLKLNGRATDITAQRACEVDGGQVVAQLNKLPVAAMTQRGKGAVLAIGFGSVWNDRNMGENWMTEPGPALKTRFELLYTIMRQFMEQKTPAAGQKTSPIPTTPDIPSPSDNPADNLSPLGNPANGPAEPKNLPIEESGPASL